MKEQPPAPSEGQLPPIVRECMTLRAALERIACWDDPANHRLELTGSYSDFDEPASVQIAREALRATVHKNDESKDHDDNGAA